MSAEQFPRAADDRTLTANCALTHRIWNLPLGPEPIGSEAPRVE